MPDSPSITRRQALAAIGVAATGVGGYVAGARTADAVPDWLASRDCSPSPLPTSPTDWPFSRYDRANTGHAPARAGPDWPVTAVWELEWPVGRDESLRMNPLVVADGVVIAVIAASSRSAVLAISLDDGRVLWRRPAEDPTHKRSYVATGTAFLSAEVPGTGVRFAARSLGDGTALWTGSVSSHVLTLVGGRLLAFDRYHAPDGHFAVIALDARTGVECWRAIHGGLPRDAAVADGRVVVPTRDRGVLAFDPTSGDRLWRSDAGGDTAAVVDELVVSTRFPGNLRTLSLADGSVEWHVRSEHFLEGGTDDEGGQYARPGFEVGAVTPEAVVYELEVYSDYPRRVQARDLATGELLWDVGPEPARGLYYGYSRPIVVGEDVLVVRSAHLDGREDPPDVLLRLDVTTGAEYDRVAFRDDEHVYRPTVADGYLLVPTNQRLIAYA